MRCAIISTALLSLLLISPPCDASEIFGDFYYGDNKIKAELSEKQLTFDQFKLGETTIKKLKNYYGEASKLGGSEQGPEKYCYQTKDGEFQIVFSSGPYGGWKYIDEIYLFDKSYSQIESCECFPSLPLLEDFSSNSYFLLGSEKQHFLNEFGKPSRMIDNKWYYYFDIKRPIGEIGKKDQIRKGIKEHYYISSFITIIFVKDKASAIAIKTLEEF